MIKYKLTDKNLRTYNGFQWEVGKKVTASGDGGLCSPGWLHYYHDPLLAVLLNPIHANIDNPRIFEVEANGNHMDDYGLKGGCTEMTIIKEVELPNITLVDRAAFGILCGKEVCEDKAFNEWADLWLSGKDRSAARANRASMAADRAAARAAWWAAMAADRAAARAAAMAAARAAMDKGVDLIGIAKKAMTIK